MQSYLIIGIGGFFGAISRYLVANWAAQRFGSEFPYGTLIINVSGCFVIGLFLTAITGRFAPPPELRLFFAVGFLGAYTTFSTFSFETLALMQSGSYSLAAANAGGSLALGMIAVIAGVLLGRFI